MNQRPFRASADTPQLPENQDVERYLLASVLVDPSNFDEIAGQLQTEDFSSQNHKLIFHAMEDLYEAQTPIDRHTIIEKLKAQGNLSRGAGLISLVASLETNMPRLVNVGHYVAIVREKSQRRKLALMFHEAEARCLRDEETTRDIAGEVEEGLLRLNRPEAEDTGLMKPVEIAAAAAGGINVFLDGTKPKNDATATGFRDFDALTAGGLREGELIILAARPAMGKTALALQIARHVATCPKNPKAVPFFAFEMSKQSLVTRLVCAEAKVDMRRFRMGRIYPAEQERIHRAMQKIGDIPLYIDDNSGTNLMEMHAKLRRLQQTSEYEVGLVVVDYLQLMQGRGRFDNRVQEISALSRGLKLMSKDLRVPFLVLSQLSRDVDKRPGDHRPVLSDLRDSGSIEQDADMVAFVYRGEVYRPDKEELKGLAELILAKHRNGPTERIHLAFDGPSMRFNPLARELTEPEESYNPRAVPEGNFFQDQQNYAD